MQAKQNKPGEQIINTTCSSHCGGVCVLRLHVKDGVITRIETEDGPEPQLRACLRGRAYRQRVYAPDRLLYPLKRVGERGEGKFARISWDEAVETIARQIIRVRDTYGPASILHLRMGADLVHLHTASRMAKVLALAGGFTETWGVASFAGGVYAQMASYGTTYTCNTRDDLLNSRLIIMWGWNPTSTVTGANTTWYLARAREAGARIVAIDPRFTDSVAVFADRWIPIRPSTDGAMLLAMAHVMIQENLHDRKFLDIYTVGFDKFRDYVTGATDGVAKTPAWAEAITGVPADTIIDLARQYATIKPAALLAGIAPGRTAYGEQYHRIAITLAAMTGNIGIHGGDAAGRSWESVPPFGGYPYKLRLSHDVGNPINRTVPDPPPGAPLWYRASKVHAAEVAEFIEKGKAGGFPADCHLVAITNCNYANAYPNTNRIMRALKSEKVEFIFDQEQFMTSTARMADIVLPTTTFMERNDIAVGAGQAFYGYAPKAIDPPGEAKSQAEIASLLAARLGVTLNEPDDEVWLKELMKDTEVPDYDQFRKQGIYRLPLTEPHVALREQIADPARHPFPTPSGKIEIYSQRWADLHDPQTPPVPQYIEPWEGRSDPLARKYPLQLISTHFKRRAGAQYENLPWLRELESQAILINTVDAQDRRINDGDTVRAFNDRGEVIIRARVTERIMPGVVDIPNGAWYNPDARGVDRAGSANVLTSDRRSPGGSFPYNTGLVQVERL